MHYSDVFSLADLDSLTAESTGPCVSIFLPTHQITNQIAEDRIRLKNLRTEAFEKLLAGGMRRPDAEALVAPVDALLEDEGFWPYLSDGLAVFCMPSFHVIYRLPVKFEPMVRVSHRFIVKPLLPLFADDGVFAVLALSRNEVRLFEGTRHSVREVDLKHLPESMSSALKIRQRPNLSPSGPLQGDEGQKELFKKFFHQVDRAIQPWLAAKKAPLVLAGVESLLPIYKSASHYRQIMADGIAGNPESLTANDLHDRAWPIVQGCFASPRKAALEKYQSLLGTGKTAADLPAILNAAIDGRIESLFVNWTTNIYGHYNTQTRQTTILEDDQQGAIDLTARVARLAHATGAAVYSGLPPYVPADGPVTAVFRY